MKLIGIANAASGLVTCSGSNCGICDFLQTIVNIYNFFLFVVFAFAILFLVLSGLNMIGSRGNNYLFSKAKENIKTIVFGFVLIILGWLVVQILTMVLGYRNSQNWWQFQCPNQVQSENNVTYFVKEENQLMSFNNFFDFLRSEDNSGKITGFLKPGEIKNQLEQLKNGEELTILAPVRISSPKKEDRFVAAFTVGNDNGNLNVSSTGEFWNYIQQEWPELSSQLGNWAQKENLDRILGNRENQGNSSLINGGGDSVDPYSLVPLYSDVSSLDSEREYKEINPDLSDMLASAFSMLSEKNPDKSSQMISNLLSQIMSSSNLIKVKKNNPDSNSTKPQAQIYCEGTGGSWKNLKCVCPQNKILKSNGKCYSQETSQKNQDSDGDGISDIEDNCPNTSSDQKDETNKQKGSSNYGCSCSEISAPNKNCPQDNCFGNSWQVYPKGKQECRNGILQTYSCNPQKSYSPLCDTNTNNNSFINNAPSSNNQKKSADDADKLKDLLNKLKENNNDKNGNGGNSGGGNGNSSGGNGSSSSSSGGNNSSSSSGGADNQNGTQNGNNNSDSNNHGDDDIRGKTWEQRQKIISQSGFCDTKTGGGNRKNVIDALKLICEHDSLKFRMIMHYVKEISNGGPRGGCGCIEIPSNMKLGDSAIENAVNLSTVIVHESGHAAEHCAVGDNKYYWTNNHDERETFSTAMEVGSDTLPDFPGQRSQYKNKNGKELMGYIPRLQAAGLGKYLHGAQTLDATITYGNSTKTQEGAWPYGREGNRLNLTDQQQIEMGKIFQLPTPCVASVPNELKSACPVQECEGQPELKIH